MPSEKTLQFFRGTDSDHYQSRIAHGAFWLNSPSSVPHIYEIQDDATSLRQTMFLMNKSPEEIEMEIRHVGNMIAQYSDAKVTDLDRRLKEAQQSALAYAVSYRDDPKGNIRTPFLYQQAVSRNLALGYEIRSQLLDTLKEIIPFGEPARISIAGSNEMAPYLYSASQYFPAQWNSVLENKLKVDFVENEDSSWYDFNDNSMQITNGHENFSSYPSMEHAHKAKNEDFRKYSTQIELVHELAHKFESINPSIADVSKTFINRRAIPGESYDPKKRSMVRDHFASTYTGTVYERECHTEVLSTGVESSLLGTNGSLVGLALPRTEGHDQIANFRADIDHRNFTLGKIGRAHV